MSRSLEADLLSTLRSSRRPLSTTELVTQHETDDRPVHAIRRGLGRLLASDQIVASGGPPKPTLPGWPDADARETWWACKRVAEDIAFKVARAESDAVGARMRRVAVLKRLFFACGAEQRRALNMIGLLNDLKADPSHRREWGAASWSNEELATVVNMIYNDRR